jgi:tetratricopeptide (TPR) repeat protein
VAAINKRKLLESAQKNLQKGALDKALKDYQDLLAADPRDANVRLKVGDLQLKRGNADEAITAYLKVADQFMRAGFDAKAVAIYKQVTKIDAKRFDVYVPLADLYQRIGLTQDAMLALQTAAEAYQKDGRRREALDLLRRMASLDPTNTTSRLKVAELLHQEKLPEEAIAEFGEAAAELERQGDWEARANVLARMIEIAPERLETYDVLIAIWLERDQHAKAEVLARKLVSLDPARAESQETLATLLRARGQEEAAIAAYRAAAEAWQARGDEERARSILQRYIPSEPFDLGGRAGPSAPSAHVGPAESPFGEEGIGGDPPPAADEFRFVDDGEPAPPSETGDIDFELEVDEAAVAPPLKTAPAAAAAPKSAPKAAPKAAPKGAAKPPAAAAAPADELVEADAEQLLAEAAVYLRYGKHERAVASLNAVLAQEPNHVGALEQLGEAHVRADAPDQAVSVWCKAFDLANTAGDAERAAALRGRIEAIDAAAAATLPPPPSPRRKAETTQPEADDAIDASESGDGEEIEIDLDADDLGGDDERPATEEEDLDVAAETADEEIEEEVEEELDEEVVDDATPLSDDDDIEISAANFGPMPGESDAAESEEAVPDEDDVDVPESFEAVEDEVADESADEPATEEPEELEFATEPETPPAAAPSAPAAEVVSDSGSSSPQIAEELEEAGFYFEQGLFDEAEAIYKRVVERAPNHPGALLRLGEIAVARGHDPSAQAAADAAPAPDAEAAPAASADAEPTIEPPDDLDLTAREFGPQRAWEDESGESEDPMATGPDAAPAAADGALDRTDPAEWTTPDASVAVELAPPAAAPPPPPPTPVAVAAKPAPPPPASEAPPAVAAAAPPLELTAPEIAAEGDGAPAFDLAAELSDALRDEPEAPARGGATEEDGFASLFSEFKRGVSRTLGEGDVETHFDLGIAYREMGLLDDAIGEFRYALGSSTRRLDALHMMGLCALDVGRAADAIGHLEQALASPDVPAEREVALRFDLGRAYELQGDRDRALVALQRVVELDAEFQDAAERIDALQSGAGPLPSANAGEAYESFDDLLAQTSDAAAEAPTEVYESFDEFQGDGGEEQGAAPADDAEPEATAVIEAEVEPEPAPEPEAEPAPEPEPTASEEPPRRKRKISFF